MPRTTTRSKKKVVPKSKSSTLRLLQLLTMTACSAGFVYGVVHSWLKFSEQPLSSTTTEVGSREEGLPSMTVCRVEYTVSQKTDWTNMTREELRAFLGMEFVLVGQG